MEPQIILDDQGIQYLPMRDMPNWRLGRGAMGEVFLFQRDTTGEKVAVKILLAHHGLATEAYQDFKAEEDVLLALQSTSASSHVPWARKGKNPYEPEQVILILEYIDPIWHLTSSARLVDNRLDESLGLETMGQYAHLLHELHHCLEGGQPGYCTRGDRKAADFYWEEQKRRLIVLDWNRAARLSENKEFAQISMRDDVRSLGQLWAGFLSGRSLTTLPEADDESNVDWCRLSRGTRRILHWAMSSRPAWALRTARDLQIEVERHLKFFQLAQEDPQKILIELQNIMDQQIKPGQVVLDEQFGRDLVDLVLRSPISSSEQKELAAGLLAQIGQLADPDQLTDALVKKLIRRIEELRPDEFSQAIQDLQRELTVLGKQKSYHAAWSRLRLQRYQIAAELGRDLAIWAKRDPEAQFKIGDWVKQVLNIIRELEILAHSPENVNEISTALMCVKKIENFKADLEMRLDDLTMRLRLTPEKTDELQKITHIVDPFLSEANLRRNWLYGIDAGSQEFFDKTLNDLETLKLSYPVYAADFSRSFQTSESWVDIGKEKPADIWHKEENRLLDELHSFYASRLGKEE